MSENEKTVRLVTLGGMARKHGTDTDGNEWIEFEVDHLAEQTEGECSICGAELSSGWMCLDGGEEVCAEHVQYPEGDGGA